jgi:hypothetical protein
MLAVPARSFGIIASLVDRLNAVRVELSRALRSVIVRPYRPERHYMRGPGPKWHEKHPASRERKLTVPLAGRISRLGSEGM